MVLLDELGAWWECVRRQVCVICNEVVVVGRWRVAAEQGHRPVQVRVSARPGEGHTLDVEAASRLCRVEVGSYARTCVGRSLHKSNRDATLAGPLVRL
jgi:hypothetical protein